MIKTILNGFQKSYISEIVKQNDFLEIIGCIYIEEKVEFNSKFDFFFERNALRRGEYINFNSIAYDDKIVKQTSKYIFNALTLFDRYDVNQNITTNQRLDIIYKSVVFWINKIQDNSIELIVSREIPHFAHEYCIYIAAKITNTKILMFDYAEHFKRTLCISSIENRLVPNINSSRENIIKSNKLLINLRKSHTEVSQNSEAPKMSCFFSKWQPFKWLHYIAYDILSLLKHGPLSYSVISILLTKNNNITKKAPIHISVRFYFFILRFKVIYLDFLYSKYSNDFNLSSIPEKKSIIYFANYQPERTTNPDGGSFSDMYNAVMLIKNGLPDDWKLIYKEHPHTFSPPFKNLFRGVLYRKASFYKQLKKEGVILAPTQEDSFELMKHSSAVCSINGTILFEAVANGKNAIILGNFFTESLEGVHKITSSKELYEFINSGNIDRPIDENKLIKNMSSVFENSVEYLNLLNNIRSFNTVKYEVSILMPYIKRNI